MQLCDRRSGEEIVHRNNKPDPTAAYFLAQRLRLLKGAELQIDESCVPEKLTKETSPGGRTQFALAAFRGVAGGDNKRGSQAREGACNFA
jgi:hypothetical protein